jgi:hypothetical protein
MGTEANHAPLPGILRLSPELRRRIYLLVGMGPWRLYNRCEPNAYNLGQQFESEPAKTRSGDNTSRFFGLLVSCQTIYTEASALLYSSNSFIFYYRRAQYLAPLQALNPRTIASLRNLKIVLNQSSCHCPDFSTSGDRCDRKTVYRAKRGPTSYCKEYHQDSHDLPISASDQSTQNLLTEWQATAAHLAAHLTPGQLELSLVCDVDKGELDVAEQVVDALRLFPWLKDSTSDSPEHRILNCASSPRMGFTEPGTFCRRNHLILRLHHPRGRNSSPCPASCAYAFWDTPTSLHR